MAKTNLGTLPRKGAGNLQVRVWRELAEAERTAVLRRSEVDIASHWELVRGVVERVRREGDAALLEYTRRWDGVDLTGVPLRVGPEELRAAYEGLDRELRDTLRLAARNIEAFHRAQMPVPLWFLPEEHGVLVGEKVSPIPDVALYVPRGKGSFPSVLLMLAIPARVAGVERVAVLTPPNPQGGVDPAVLAAAHLTGVTELYRVGGIQAVAAVAFGTESVPRCGKILGPGSGYVTAAKRYLFGHLDVGVPAGPSEAVILADETVDPAVAALDLCIEAEHGPDSAALLVTPSRELARSVGREVDRLVENLSPYRRGFVEAVLGGARGGAILTEDLDAAVEFVNAFAPEHMEVLVRDPWELLPRLHHAGEILLGEHTPITLANFLLGPNAILPTGGFARTYSALSVHDFLKRSSVAYVSAQGFAHLGPHARRFAAAEGFEAHARAVEGRKRLQ